MTCHDHKESYILERDRERSFTELASGLMATSASPGEGEEKIGSSDERYECNICFEQATEAVISMCGHLFCWPCIHRWMESKPNNPTCPVCKSRIERERLIPLYGRGATDKSDPRDKVPPRPQGQRQEPAHQNDTGMDGIQFSFGIGAFPFAMMGGPMFQAFGNNRQQRGQGAAADPQAREQQQRLAAMFTTFAILLLVLIVFS